MALIHIGGKSYELIYENRTGWNPEAFRNRYSEVLERYDYIIGDWGYNQLRLKGFFRDNHQKATRDSTFSTISDYINEYCNFGCAYFVLEKKQGAKREPSEEDTDLDAEYGEDVVRLEGFDIRAGIESAAASASEETATAAEQPRHSAKESAAPVQQQQNRHRHTNRGDGGNRQSGKGGGGNGQAGSAAGNGSANVSHEAEGQGGQGQGRRKDQNYRGKSNRGGHDYRGKKPVKVAANETAAASEQSRQANPNQKDAGRSS
ncbi:YutD family protein [Paenibacillus sp. GCM10027627]|uniref:YutD family protein n=1 Tax=unclassified Paenibacillus TaxID=185978 RepID=UPI003640DBB7